MFDLSDKTALITGGNGGIGLGIAEGYLRFGASLIIVGRNEEKNEESRAYLTKKFPESKLSFFICDITEVKSVDAMFREIYKEYKHLDILVNNAGINIRATEPQELSFEDWSNVISTNLSSMHIMSSKVVEGMKKNGSGKIINIGSMLSIFGSTYGSAYAASKGGVVQYTKSCADGWSKDNIQVNAILPGWIVTAMTEKFRITYPERHALIEPRTPAGRWGTPNDLAGTAIFLASEASQFVSGVSIPVDGGYSIR
ncbi:MAG: SDR family NAD(P)-dependent oxidoreductase [Dehalococcoidia bacterium]